MMSSKNEVGAGDVEVSNVHQEEAEQAEKAAAEKAAAEDAKQPDAHAIRRYHEGRAGECGPLKMIAIFHASPANAQDGWGVR